MIEEQYRTSKVESLILASPEPLASRRITKVIDDITPGQVSRAVADLNTGYATVGSSFRIREIAGGYQFYILAEYEGVVESLFAKSRKIRLSRAALETISIVAYRQPATKIEIEHIRGVASDGVLRTLLEKGLVAITGRADTVGKPLQYGTTNEFLKFFGLSKLDDLPQMSEIEQMISSEESRKQTEMEFAVDADGQVQKLNIADGSFDPESRDRLEDGTGDDVNDDITVDEETSAVPVQSSEPTADIDDSVGEPAEASETSETIEPAEPAEPDEPDEATSETKPPTLVLKKGSESTSNTLASEPDNDDTEVEEEPAVSGAGQD